LKKKKKNKNIYQDIDGVTVKKFKRTAKGNRGIVKKKPWVESRIDFPTSNHGKPGVKKEVGGTGRSGGETKKVCRVVEKS